MKTKLQSLLAIGLIAQLAATTAKVVPEPKMVKIPPKGKPQPLLKIGRPQQAVADHEKLSRKALTKAYGKRQAKRIRLKSNVPGYAKPGEGWD